MNAVADGRPKCALPLRGRPLIDHQRDLLEAAGAGEVVVITGWQADAVRAAAGGRSRFRHFAGFAGTNNFATLRAHADLLNGEVLILFADVLVSRSALRRLVDDPHDIALLADTRQVRSGTMRIRHANDRVADIGGHIAPADGTGNFVGIARCSARGSSVLRAELLEMGSSEFSGDYWTAALPRLVAKGGLVHVVPVDSREWLEIDTPQDYRDAQRADFYAAAGPA